MLIISSKKQKINIFIFFYSFNGLSLAVMAFTKQSIVLMFIVILLFLNAFNFLEVSLPAFISMLAAAASKGTAMGIYSTYQFLGAFIGGIVGGLSYKLVSSSGLFLCLAGLMIVWFLLSLGMHNPSKIRTFTFTSNIKDQQQTNILISQLVTLGGALKVVHIKANTELFQQQQRNTF